MDTKTDVKPPKRGGCSLKLLFLYCTIYVVGLGIFFLLIAEPFTMSTYFSDNSLLPGLVNREFSLGTEAEYYLKDLNKLSRSKSNLEPSFATLPAMVDFIKQELDSFGLDAFEQNFNFNIKDKQYNGTNVYSIIRGERSTSSESIVLCTPFKTSSQFNTLSSVALSLALAKYFSTRSYWAKDVIILFIDHDHFGTSAWLDSYYDVNFKSDLKRLENQSDKDKVYYDSLEDRSGPMQAAIVLELHDRQFTQVNVKIQGFYGQLPNLDLFNLIIELAARESVTPHFHNKTLPFALSTEELYRHHLETAISFIQTQATMQSDGLHGLFLKYAVQALTLECPKMNAADSKSHMVATLLNMGRLVEGVFRSLNNLTERFNRSFYFYIILSLRRFTSIGYYMIALGIMQASILLKAINIYIHVEEGSFVGVRPIILLTAASILSLLSTFNISTALVSSAILVPILIFI